MKESKQRKYGMVWYSVWCVGVEIDCKEYHDHKRLVAVVAVAVVVIVKDDCLWWLYHSEISRNKKI